MALFDLFKTESFFSICQLTVIRYIFTVSCCRHVDNLYVHGLCTAPSRAIFGWSEFALDIEGHHMTIYKSIFYLRSYGKLRIRHTLF